MNAPVKTVSLSRRVLSCLFAAGNWGSGDAMSATDMARNVLEHTVFELKMLGECIVNSEDRAFDEKALYERAYNLAAQLEAAIEIISALEVEAVE